MRDGKLKIFCEECFERCRCRILVCAFEREGDGLAALDAETHQRKHLARVNGLAALGQGRGSGEFLELLDQQAGRTGMDALRILNGLGNFLHGNRSPFRW